MANAARRSRREDAASDRSRRPRARGDRRRAEADGRAHGRDRLDHALNELTEAQARALAEAAIDGFHEAMAPSAARPDPEVPF